MRSYNDVSIALTKKMQADAKKKLEIRKKAKQKGITISYESEYARLAYLLDDSVKKQKPAAKPVVVPIEVKAHDIAPEVPQIRESKRAQKDYVVGNNELKEPLLTNKALEVEAPKPVKVQASKSKWLDEYQYCMTPTKDLLECSDNVWKSNGEDSRERRCTFKLIDGLFCKFPICFFAVLNCIPATAGATLSSCGEAINECCDADEEDILAQYSPVDQRM